MDLYKSLQEGVNRERLYNTLLFYVKLWSYVITLYSIVLIYKVFVPIEQIVALNPVITYAMLLALLCYLYCYHPERYVKLKDWCGPGNIFLRFWINMNIFAYLTQIPVVLAPYSPIDAFSWFIQSTCISPIVLLLNAMIASGFIYLARKIYHIEDRKTLVVETTAAGGVGVGGGMGGGVNNSIISSSNSGSNRSSLSRISSFRRNSDSSRKSATVNKRKGSYSKGLSVAPRAIQNAIKV